MLFLFAKGKFSFKYFVLKFFAVCLIWFLFVYIVRSLFFGLLSRYEHVDVYDHVSFDFVVNDPYAGYYDREISTQPFVQSELRTIGTGGDLTHNEESGTTSTMNIVADNFDGLFQLFPRSLFVSIDEALLTSRDGILLTFGLAQAMRLKPGDIVSISGREKIVAGIYEDSIFNVIHADSITLWDEDYGAQFENIGFDFYGKVYIKTSDYDTATAYFEQAYFQHLGYISDLIGNGKEKEYINQYGEEWIEKAIEEAVANTDLNKNYRQNAFISRKTLKAYARNEYAQQYSLNQDIAYSVISVIALFAVCILESYKHAVVNQQKFALLRMLGTRRGHMFLFYFLRSFILQSGLMLFGVWYVRFRVRHSRYISNILTAQWMLYFEVVIFAAALISSVVSMRKLSDKALLFSLNAEGSVD